MKFSNRLDLELFLTEVGKLELVGQVDESFVPPKEMEESFIKRRSPLVGAIKSFRRSQKTKEAWKKSRWKFMKGIKRFHNSTEGKRFHRNMGRFLSTRYFHPTMRSVIGRDQDQTPTRSVKESLNIFELADILKAITSAKTHSFIELEYFMPLTEEVEYWVFLDEILPALDSIEKKIWLSDRLDDQDVEVLFRLTEKNEMIKALVEALGIEYKEIEAAWNEFEEKSDMEEDICFDLIGFIESKHAEVVKELTENVVKNEPTN